MHEIEHLNKNNVAPRWFLTFPDFEYDSAFDPDVGMIVKKDLINKSLSHPDTRIFALFLKLVLPNSPDNLVEDVFINEHLVKLHGVKMEDLKALGFDLMERISQVTDLFRKFDKLKHKKVGSMEEFMELIPKIPFVIGSIINTFGDLSVIIFRKVDPLHFYDKAIREVEKYMNNLPDKDILDKIWRYKVELEYTRLLIGEYIFSILLSMREEP